MRVGNFWNNNNVEYESNSDKKKTLLIKENTGELNHTQKVSQIIWNMVNSIKFILIRQW